LLLRHLAMFKAQAANMIGDRRRRH
jgi:hypothetical protein